MENASLLTIPQLAYQGLYRAVHTWLLGLNTRRIPVHLQLVAAFLAGVLWTRGAATCKAIAQGGAFSHDALNRLLIGPALRGVLQMAALTRVDRTTGYLVIDDVVLDKVGDKIEGIAWLHSSSLDQKVRALNVVVLGWTNGKVFIPLGFRFWKPPETKDGGKPSAKAFDGTPFRTKLELAVELLRWARGAGFTPTAVLFDGYYLTKPVLKVLRKAGWQWVSRIKGNRNLESGNMVFQPDHWPLLAKHGVLPKLTKSVRATLPGWGDVRMIAVRRKGAKEPAFLVGSNPEWGHGTIERLYGYRWDIEVAFRNTKQLAGLNDCQCRSLRAQENHVALVFLAYLFVQAQGRPAETAGATLQRVKDRPVVTPAVIVPMKVRPIVSHKNARSRKAHSVRHSARAA